MYLLLCQIHFDMSKFMLYFSLFGEIGHTDDPPPPTCFVVFASEVYSAIAVRTAVSIRFFPRFFFIYFVLFHVYFFSFPFGFAYLAALVTFGLMAHTMLHFWDRFEVFFFLFHLSQKGD